jgi:hypothetical protein
MKCYKLNKKVERGEMTELIGLYFQGMLEKYRKSIEERFMLKFKISNLFHLSLILEKYTQLAVKTLITSKIFPTHKFAHSITIFRRCSDTSGTSLYGKKGGVKV